MNQFDIKFAKFIVDKFKQGEKKGSYDDGTYLIFGTNEINQVVFMKREGKNIIRKIYENGNKKEFFNGSIVLEVEGNVKKEYDRDLGLVKMVIEDHDRTLIVEAKQYLTKLTEGDDMIYDYYVLFDRKGKVPVDLSNLIPPEFHDKLENVSLYYAEYPGMLAFKDNNYTIIIYHDKGHATELVVWYQEEVIKEIRFREEGETRIEFSREIVPFELEVSIQSSIIYGEPVDYEYQREDLVWIVE